MPPSSGPLTPLGLILPTHLSAICNRHSLLQPGTFNQPATVRRLLLASQYRSYQLFSSPLSRILSTCC